MPKGISLRTLEEDLSNSFDEAFAHESQIIVLHDVPNKNNCC